MYDLHSSLAFCSKDSVFAVSDSYIRDISEYIVQII